MPLIACPDCKNPISERAPACIHCGRPMVNGLEHTPHASQSMRMVGGEGFRIIGWLLVAGGVVGLVVFGLMDTTVATGSGTQFILPDRIHNLGLMDERRSGLIVSSLAALAGVVSLGFGYSLRRPALVPKGHSGGKSASGSPLPERVDQEYVVRCPVCENREALSGADRYNTSKYTQFEVVEQGFFVPRFTVSCHLCGFRGRLDPAGMRITSLR